MCSGSLPFATYRALVDGGMTRRVLRANLATGSLMRARRGVYAGLEACDPATRAVAHGGVLACVTAARHLGLWVLDDSTEVHVWLRGDSHAYGHTDCACIEHWDAAPHVEGFGLPSVPRILRQILSCRGIEQFFVTLESALRRGLLNRAGLPWLAAHTNDLAREALRFARYDADSGLESLVRWRLRGYGLEVRTQVRLLAVGRVDLLIGERLVVETDGRENHDGDAHRHRDLVRDANAAIWGYATLRFDYAMIVHDWDLVERAILAAVSTSSSR
jgi:very-short-patch-repair endonuclease